MTFAAFLLRLVLAGSALIPSAAVGSAATPHPSAGQTGIVALGAEAWYSNPKLCLLPSVCLPIASPLGMTYPANTLHIGAAGGAESARTYLALRRPISSNTTVTAGELRLLLDTSPADGSVVPDLAKVKACTTTARIKAVDGSTATPPAVDCAGAPISRVIGTPATELDINLRPLAHRLAQPGTGLALLPDLTLGATWNVTLSSNQRRGATASTPVLILTTVTRSASTPSGAVTSPPTPTTTKSARPHSPTSAGGSVAIPTGPVTTVPEAQQVPSSGDQPQVAPSTSPTPIRLAAQSGVHGFDYPVVFLVPLLVLAGLLGFGRQLTKPLFAADNASVED